MTEKRQSDDATPSDGEAPARERETPTGSDVVVLGRALPDREAVSVLRVRDGRAELGALQPLRHGKPIQGELVTLTPRPELPIVCDVKVELSVPDAVKEPARHGPAQVASDRYRANWDAIWAKGPGSERPS